MPSAAAATATATSERGRWSDPCDFFVSCLGYAVGLGNVWRFPFLCFKHGGGAFLVPYFLMLFSAGLPVFFLEIFLGQYAGVGPVKTFGHLVPLLRGLGYAVVSVGLLFAFFYIVVVSWSVWYLAASIGFRLEWAYCGHDYNTDDCYEIAANASTGAVGKSSVEQYWERYVLGSGGRDWNDFGYPRLHSIGTLLISWILVCACLIRGIRSSGRVVYFTSFFPYAVLSALAVRGLTMPGATDGIAFLFSPKWELLANPQIWTDAATQVIFSLGPACGCLLTMSSYSKFDRNCHRDAVIIAVCNCATSILCGVVVFSALGFIAHDKGVEIEQVLRGGPGLAFIVYPEVLTRMTASNLWSALFFAMLISLALGCIFGAFETVVSAVSDQFPAARRHKSLLVVAMSAAMFALGLVFTCGGGIHAFTLFNAAAPSWNLLLFTFLEVVAVSWIYGTDNVIKNLAEMKMSLSPVAVAYWTLCWRYLTPAVLLALLVTSWVNFGSVDYGDYVYPLWVQAMGYVITACTVVWIPIFGFTEAVRNRCHNDATPKLSLLRPTTHWGRKTIKYGPCGKEQEDTIPSKPKFDAPDLGPLGMI